MAVLDENLVTRKSTGAQGARFDLTAGACLSKASLWPFGGNAIPARFGSNRPAARTPDRASPRVGAWRALRRAVVVPQQAAEALLAEDLARGGPPTRRGRVSRRQMRFSALGYWTWRASSRSVAVASITKKGWKRAFTGLPSVSRCRAGGRRHFRTPPRRQEGEGCRCGPRRERGFEERRVRTPSGTRT